MEKAAAKSTSTAEANARAAEEPQRCGPDSHPLFRLQSVIGNQGVQRLLRDRIIQTKLAVSHPPDAYEQEADHIAEHVVGTREPLLQRACDCGGGCPKCKTQQGAHQHERLQTKQSGPASFKQTGIPPTVHEVLRSPGQSLDAATRAVMEPRFGQDFSHVRLHTDARAAESAQAVNARAFTVGRHMVFAPGTYAPSTPDGQRLLAHELTHTLQQRNAHDAVSARLRITAPNDSHEAEADSVARGVSRDVAPEQSADAARAAAPVSVTPTGAQIARQWDWSGDTPEDRLEEAKDLLLKLQDANLRHLISLGTVVELKSTDGSPAKHFSLESAWHKISGGVLLNESSFEIKEVAQPDPKARKIVIDGALTAADMALVLYRENKKLAWEASDQRSLETSVAQVDTAKARADYVKGMVDAIVSRNADILWKKEQLKSSGATVTIPLILDKDYSAAYDKVFREAMVRGELGPRTKFAAHEAGFGAIRAAIESGKIDTHTHEKYGDYFGKDWDKRHEEWAKQNAERGRKLSPVSGSGQYEQQQQERKAQEQASKPSPPARQESSGDYGSLVAGMRQIDIDRAEQSLKDFGFRRQLEEPPLSPKAVETPGCHPDPYARHPASTVCGQKRPDEATQAAMRAMQSPALDLDEFKKQQRARLDRLNALYLEARRTQTFPATNEFSQYEIALDREVDVATRWQISAKEHGVGENDLELDHYNTLLFRSRYEYDSEYRRRENMHKEEVKCESGHGIKLPKLSRKHPEWIDCENEVDAKYYPRAHAQKEAARWKAYIDIQAAMPALTQGGLVSAFGFHVAHEWLGWSTERSAAFAGALSTATGVGMLKAQQVFSNRNVGRSVAPPDEMTPPPEHVAPPPGRYPAPPPGKPPVLQTEPPPAPVKQLQTEPPPAPVKQLQTEPPPAPVKQLQTEPPPAPVKQLQTEPPPPPVKQSQTEPPPAPLRQQLRQNLEVAVNKIYKDIADVSAAKGRVQRQLASINEQLKTATKEERGRLIELREKLKLYQEERLGSGADLGQKLVEAKELLRGNESDYFKALTSAASKKTGYISVKNRKVDEVFKTTDTDLEVEHVYPRSKIWNTPGFVEKLSWKQQIAVFNYAKNLKLMSAKANLARSNIPYRSLPRKIWSRFTSDESVVTNLSRLEDEVQRDIVNMIKDPSLIPIAE